MARAHTKKEETQKKKLPKEAKDKSVAQKPKSQTKPKDQLREQISSLGGDAKDLELLENVHDSQLEIGDQGHDPTLANDVSKFLKGLKTGKSENLPKTEKPSKAKATPQKPEPPNGDKKGKKRKEQQKETSREETVVAEAKPVVLPVVSLPKGSKLVFPPGPQWYTAVPSLPAPNAPLPSPSISQLSSLTERAADLLKKDAEMYQSSAASTGHSSSDSHFLNTILTQGTLSDRLSALTLLVQGSPVHNSKALEQLKGMAERGRGKGGREEGLKAMRCIVDWWVGGGAPNRKLRYLRDQPFLLHPNVTDQHLVQWYFEDWLKKFFYSILQILETYSLDPLQYVRTQALASITTLLREKPEQEQNLLRLLVNKMGDTEKSVCSRASYHLLQVLQAHPAMKGVIVREVRTLIFRPTASTSSSIQEAVSKANNTHIRFNDDEDKKKAKEKPKAPVMDRWNSHSWYYSSVTLNQIVLTPSDQDRETARLLIEVYFEMFREILGSVKEDAEDAAQVPGIEDDKEGPKKKAKGKEKAVQGAAGFTEVEDANSRLVSAILSGVNRALPFAKVDSDGGSEMFKKHIDTLFLITHTSTFNISLQALMLILQVITTFAGNASSSSKSSGSTFSTTISDRFYRTLYASLLDPRLSKSNKQAMYLNLLFKAVKVDQNLERVKAFVRRFVQVLAAGVGGSGGPEFVAGGLYLLGELFSTVSGLREMINTPPMQGDVGEAYDPRKRDPQYAHASGSPLYELIPLTYHYHPSVSLHARQLLSSIPITASADLSINTLSHFLDRFVFKNPKKPKAKGASAMQPAATTADSASGVKLIKGEALGQGGPVNEESWWKRRVEDVPADEVFFHKYFQRKHEEEQKKKAKIDKRKGQDDDSDEEEGEESDGEEDEDDVAENASDDESDSDKEEAEIWKAMKASMPTELQDDDLMDDSDDVPSDLDDDEVELSDNEDGTDAEEENEQEQEQDADDAFSLVEGSDAEDLIPMDGDIPDGLIDYDGPDSDGGGASDEEEWTGFGDASTSTKKRKRGDEEKSGKNKKKLKSLPTFASYEDYAKLIEDGPEDNI
ncbi:CBF-domain-containing protein [Cristinia sonorae]|uniref:CBF-domain-containing protein n=1 Tax=Cristinia sonorae TaxID=1940300 RepID=A0A8K0UVJ1_9AGAR|nr:CBF-domain-containing protein [Cristinia sonorae]